MIHPLRSARCKANNVIDAWDVVKSDYSIGLIQRREGS